MTLLLAAVLLAGVPLDDAIHRASLETGVSAVLLDELAFCESSKRLQAVGDGGRAVGPFQWHLGPWTANAARIGIYGDHRTDPYASARVTAHKIAREGLWPWANCARKMGF